MKIEFVRNFIKLIQYQSFSELAKDLNISQSTLSNQINQLEKEFGGIKLIDRTTRKFNVTPEGQIFLSFAKKIVELYDTCKHELSKYLENRTEEIIITASTYPGSQILPKFLASFKNDYPNVNFKIIINNSQKSIDLINKELADFAGVGSFMDYDKNSFEYIKIGEDQLVFISSPNHKLLKSGENLIEFKELVKCPYISREKGSGTRNIIQTQFPDYNQLNIKLEMNDNDSIISAVSESNYISVISENVAKKAQDAGLIKILNVKEYPIIAKRDIYFLKLKDKKLSDLKKEFWEHLKA